MMGIKFFENRFQYEIFTKLEIMYEKKMRILGK